MSPKRVSKKQEAPQAPGRYRVIALELDLIRTDGGTQTRIQMNQETILSYAEQMAANPDQPNGGFDPIVVFGDGVSFWPGDGHHRLAAAKLAKLPVIWAEVRAGTQEDALEFALSANSKNPLQRTNADKQNAVKIALAHPRFSQLSDSEIARLCAVSQPFVSRVREELEQAASYNGFKMHTEEPTSVKPETNEASSAKPKIERVRRVRRAGKEYLLDTSRIGKKRAARPGAKAASYNGFKMTEEREASGERPVAREARATYAELSPEPHNEHPSIAESLYALAREGKFPVVCFNLESQAPVSSDALLQVSSFELCGDDAVLYILTPPEELHRAIDFLLFWHFQYQGCLALVPEANDFLKPSCLLLIGARGQVAESLVEPERLPGDMREACKALGEMVYCPRKLALLFHEEIPGWISWSGKDS